MSGGATWIRDLTLGARFAVTGGRRGWTRTILTAIGVGLGVSLLLVAASVPHLIESRDTREADRTVTFNDEVKRSERSFLFAQTSTLYRGDTVNGAVFRPDGGNPRRRPAWRSCRAPARWPSPPPSPTCSAPPRGRC